MTGGTAASAEPRATAEPGDRPAGTTT